MVTSIEVGAASTEWQLASHIGVVLTLLAASSSVVCAERRGALEIARGIHLVPPAAWQERDRTRNSVELVKTAPSDPNAVLVRTLITTETRTSAEEAVQRLGDIAAEQPQPPALLTIGGWPAIERRTTVPLPRVGGDPGQVPGAPPASTVTSTIAIAAGATIVRFETTLMPGAAPRLLDEILARVRQLDLEAKGDPKQAQRALEEVRRVMRKRLEAAPAPPPATTAPHGT